MFPRRSLLIGSAGALGVAVLRPAVAQPATVPATRRGFLDRPGCRLYFEVTGSGPALVFAHGLGSNHLTWWQQVTHFCHRYSRVTFAHRGYPPAAKSPVDPIRGISRVISPHWSSTFNFAAFASWRNPWAAGPASSTSSTTRTRCERWC